MVVIFLKNGEKAPLPDATHVRLDSEADGGLLRVYYNDQEVGLFKWEDVAGYSIAASPPDLSSVAAYRAWGLREP